MLCRRVLVCTSFLFCALFLSHCATFTPDRYQGDGTWVRRDGTIYPGAPPLAVLGVEMLHSSVNRDLFIEQVETVNDAGQTVIREEVTVSMRVDADLLILLEGGSQHEVVIQANAPAGGTRSMSVSFTAPNGKIYRAMNSFMLDERRPSVRVRVSAPGPVAYTTTFYLD
jgi:hypothetical protein